MDYGRLLSRSLELAWRHKWLWLLAFFAGESSTVPGFNGGSFNSGSRTSTPNGGAPDLRPVGEWVTAHAALLLLAGAVLVLVWIVLFVLSCACVAAAVRGADELDRDQPCDLGRAWGLGLPRFGAVLRLRLLVLLAWLAVVLVIGVMVVLIVLAAAVHAYASVAVVGVLLANVAVVLFVVLVVVPVYLRLALRMIVLDGAGAVAGLRGGVTLMRSRLGRVAVLWAIELAISLGMGIVAAVVLFAIAVPAAIFGYGAFVNHSGVALGGLGAVVLVVVAALLVFGAAVAGFRSVYWTLGYRRLPAAP